jgi:type II secretory pathway pseudopilin PulG
VVLAIIAVLAAVLTPMVMNYVEQGRIARAQADVRTIADAVRLYQRDTGRWPVYDSSTAYTSATAAATVLGSSQGSNPGNGTVSWNVSDVIGTTSLESFLNNNYSSVTANGFPKVTFNGPYIGTVDSDPWGNKYLLTSGNLAGSTNHAYAISAGPNGVLDTTLNVPVGTNLNPGGDDLISMVR